jgi:acyl-CoA synthetase
VEVARGAAPRDDAQAGRELAVQPGGDEGQYLRYVDRFKDLVVRGGMKISAAELERFIAGRPKAADVAVVVAYPDEVLGERACAIVVPRPGETVTLAEVVAYLREIGIATFKLPERLELRDELPRNPLGKILKRELREEIRGSRLRP